jgi:nucleotide-binding universal stress UspA family protein
MKILVAIDDSQYSEAVVRQLIAQAAPRDTQVRVLHVIEAPSFPDSQAWGYAVPVREVGHEQREEAERLVARAAQQLRDAGFSVVTGVEVGAPKVVIIDSATQWGADLIMLGSHGRKGLDRFLMGSVSEAVSRHAPCSVQITRIGKH